jgi:hypothetical protein
MASIRRYPFSAKKIGQLYRPRQLTANRLILSMKRLLPAYLLSCPFQSLPKPRAAFGKTELTGP